MSTHDIQTGEVTAQLVGGQPALGETVSVQIAPNGGIYAWDADGAPLPLSIGLEITLRDGTVVSIDGAS